jgi:chromodomain-helicase-DNA-binding protein 4
LIEKTETEETKEATPTEGNFSFSFAKIWAADKNTLEEVADDLPQKHEVDSWANTLQRIQVVSQMERKEEVTGRGVRRKAAAVFTKVHCIRILILRI